MTEEIKTTANKVGVALKNLGYEYDMIRGWMRKDVETVVLLNDNAKLMATRIQNELERLKYKGIPSVETIVRQLELYQSERQGIHAEHCYDVIKYNPQAVDKFDDLAKLISGDKYNELYPHILRQIIYSIKRKMTGREVRCPIFVIFYGGAGKGKTTLIRKLCEPLPSNMVATVKQGDKLVNSEKHSQMLIDNLIIHLEEMSGMNKASVETLKTIVDMERVSFVRLYENTTTSGFVKATLLGGSNAEVKNILISTDDNRKWCQIDFYGNKDMSEDECRGIIGKIMSFDVISLYQSIDENGAEPFGDSALYAKYRAFTSETCSSNTPTTDWIEDFASSYGGSWISKKEIYNKYYEEVKTHSNPMRKDLFQQVCEKRGFVFKRQSGVGIYGYDIPKRIVENPDIMDIEAMAKQSAEISDRPVLSFANPNSNN